jgi:hypothetical protein
MDFELISSPPTLLIFTEAMRGCVGPPITCAIATAALPTVPIRSLDGRSITVRLIERSGRFASGT